jgi:hypothetical protein
MVKSNTFVASVISTIYLSKSKDSSQEFKSQLEQDKIFTAENIKIGEYTYESIVIMSKNGHSKQMHVTTIDTTTRETTGRNYYDIRVFSKNTVSTHIRITFASAKERDTMYTYLTTAHGVVDRIQWALDSVSKYIGITTYKQESGTLRTGNTKQDLEYMDCTEFVARFLQLACGLEQIPQFATGDLAPVADAEGMYGNYLQFVAGSNNKTYTDIRPGDIFLWRTDNNGHVGVVESYTEPYVYIIEALTTSCEASLNTGTCTYCVKRSKYTRIGNALLNHGDDAIDWKGYFRPIINKK